MIVKGPSSTIGQYVCSEQLADIITESNCKAHLYLAESIDAIRLARDEYRLARLKEAMMYRDAHFGVNKTVHYHGDNWTIVSIPSSQNDVHSYVLRNKEGKTLSVVPTRMISEATPVDEPLPQDDINPYLEQTVEQHTEQVYEGSLILDDKQLIDAIQQRVDELFESRMEEFLDKCAERIGRTIDSSGNDSPGDMTTEAEHKE